MTEKALALEELTNEHIINFKARRGLGAYLCRYQDCYRSIDGFDSADLRQQHEHSHVARFQCCGVGCGFFGWRFKTKSALRNHDIKYHAKATPQLVPNQLSKAFQNNASTRYQSTNLSPDYSMAFSKLEVRQGKPSSNPNMLKVLNAKRIDLIGGRCT